MCNLLCESIGINCGLRFTCIILFTVCYTITVIFSALATSGPVEGLFNASLTVTAADHETWMSASTFTFHIWSVIYLFIGCTVGYNISLIFREGKDGKLMFLTSPTVQPAYLVLMSLSFICTNVWCFLFDKLDFVSATYAIAMSAYFAWLAMYFFCKEFLALRKELEESERKWITGLVENGSAMYTTWVTVATPLSCSVALLHTTGVDFMSAIATSVNTTLAETIADIPAAEEPVMDDDEMRARNESIAMLCLGGIILMLVLYIPLENLLADAYMRYIVTPYIVLAWAIGGIYAKQKGNTTDKIEALQLALLIFSVILILLRAAVVILKFFYRPLDDMESISSSIERNRGKTYN